MTDITRKRGDTYADEFVVRSVSTGSPLNLVGSTFFLTVDPDQFPTTATANLYKLTGVLTDAVNGKVEFAPTAVQADKVGKYFYDMEMVDAAGRRRTLDAGKYTYIQDIGK